MSSTETFLQNPVQNRTFSCVRIPDCKNQDFFSNIPVSSEQKNLLRSYISQGLLTGFRSDDLKDLTAEDAEFYIQCAEDNRWLTDKSIREYCTQTDIDTSPASPDQLSKIITLSKEGYLRRIASATLLKLCNLTARQLIWRGEMQKRST